MASRAAVVTSLFLAACGGTTYYAGATQTTALAPADAYECAKTQFMGLGYKTAVHDDDARRLVGQKRDTVTHIADIQLRKVFDQLEVDAKATKEGTTALTVLARSFEERSNAGGVRVDERKASSQVQTDAVALLKNCGASGE